MTPDPRERSLYVNGPDRAKGGEAPFVAITGTPSHPVAEFRVPLPSAVGGITALAAAPVAAAARAAAGRCPTVGRWRTLRPQVEAAARERDKAAAAVRVAAAKLSAVEADPGSTPTYLQDVEAAKAAIAAAEEAAARAAADYRQVARHARTTYDAAAAALTAAAGTAAFARQEELAARVAELRADAAAAAVALTATLGELARATFAEALLLGHPLAELRAESKAEVLGDRPDPVSDPAAAPPPAPPNPRVVYSHGG